LSTVIGAIGPHRRVAFAELSLSAVKGVKDALGGTVNDVVLAAAAGALRDFLAHRDQPLDQPLVAMVPISVRAAEGPDELGNQVSAMLVPLPVHEPDPLRRLEQVRDGTRDAKQQHGALGADTLRELAQLTPGGAASLAARLYTSMQGAQRHRPIWNTVVSNVPGPRFPLYCAGARLDAIYPLGPCHEMVGLNVTLFSYRDTIFAGLNADRDMVPDVRLIADRLADAVEELSKAAGEQR
jgi:diacylglycerol O-acyltransferase / wax synthase